MSSGAFKPGSEPRTLTLTLVNDGESQVVRLPQEFRLAGDAVEVQRVDAGLLLRPVAARKKVTREELDAFWARLDSYGADPGRDQGVFELRDIIK